MNELFKRKSNPVDDFFESKKVESKEAGKPVAFYTIGADIGFVSDGMGGIRPVVFEVNGKNSGLTVHNHIKHEKNNKGYKYDKRMFREIRRSESREVFIEKILRYDYIMSYIRDFCESALENPNSERFKEIERVRYLPELSQIFFQEIVKRNNKFISFLHDFFKFHDDYSEDAYFEKRLNDFILEHENDERVLNDNACQTLMNALKYLSDRMGKVTGRRGYDNLDGSEEIFEDKIHQQLVIPDEYKIKSVNEFGFFVPKSKWFMVKQKDLSRGFGVKKMHVSEFLKIYFSKKRKMYLESYLVQELVQTVGADNASHEVSKNHSSMRLLLDIQIIKDSNGELSAVLVGGGTTHNIYPVRDDNKDSRWFWQRLPEWAKIEPSKGAHPIEPSQREIEMGREVVKKIALTTYELLHGKNV